MLLPVTDTYLEQRVNNLFNSYGTKLIVEDYVDLFFNCNLRKSNSGTEKLRTLYLRLPKPICGTP